MNKYSSLHVEIPEPQSERIVKYAKGLIEDDHLLELELEPHVTIKYGIETNRVEEVAAALGEFKPIRLMFGKTSVFMANDYNKHDVLKIDMFVMSLNRLRQRVVDNLDTAPHKWPEYSPHLTLAVLDTNCGLWYVGNNPVIGEKVVVDNVVFSPVYGKRKLIYTDGRIEEYANI